MNIKTMELNTTPTQASRSGNGKAILTVILTLCAELALGAGGWLIIRYVRDPFSPLRSRKVSFNVYVPSAVSKWVIPKTSV